MFDMSFIRLVCFYHTKKETSGADPGKFSGGSEPPTLNFNKKKKKKKKDAKGGGVSYGVNQVIYNATVLFE